MNFAIYLGGVVACLFLAGVAFATDNPERPHHVGYGLMAGALVWPLLFWPAVLIAGFWLIGATVYAIVAIPQIIASAIIARGVK